MYILKNVDIKKINNAHFFKDLKDKIPLYWRIKFAINPIEYQH